MGMIIVEDVEAGGRENSPPAAAQRRGDACLMEGAGPLVDVEMLRRREGIACRGETIKGLKPRDACAQS